MQEKGKCRIFANEGEVNSMQRKNNIILLPTIPAGSPLGKVFNDYFIISVETEMMDGDAVVWDFSNVTLLHPFFIFLLMLYKSVSKKRIECINADKEIETYLQEISFFESPDRSSEDFLEYLNHYSEAAFVPYCSFDADDDKAQEQVERMIKQQCHANPKLGNPLSYFLGELICNIEQHSGDSKVYFFSQYQQSDDTIFLCIADKGIGVYSSYVETDKYLSKIGDDDSEALKIANEGYSTKNLPDAENRGFGISTTKRMLVEGLKGSFCMMSGNAFMSSIPGAGEKYISLPKEIEWQGTIVLLQIPCKVDEDFQFYNYV